jgi:hypothetical protein
MLKFMPVAVSVLLLLPGCAPLQPLPDQASMDAPKESAQIVVLPEWPTQGKRYLVERDGQQEIWLVKDDKGTIEFLDQATQQAKLWIRLGRCLSFSYLQGPRSSPHDFGAVGQPAFHTAPPDCKVWDGRTWTQTYAVQMPRLAQPCYYGARRKAKVEGTRGRRLVTSDSSVEITGPGVPGGYYATQYRIVYSEELQFFKELAPGYIGRRATVVRELK